MLKVSPAKQRPTGEEQVSVPSNRELAIQSRLSASGLFVALAGGSVDSRMRNSG